jgi:diacylglycerol kinase (ATP)
MGEACLIVNPAAGRGSTSRELPQLVRTFARVGITHVLETRAMGDEERVTRGALDAGRRVIVSVGGDGTCARVADAILRSRSPCALSVVPYGTGNDFAKTLGLNNYSAEQIAALVARGDTTRIDVGLADGHYFLNSCGFGFDASVLAATKRVRFLKGDAVYIYSALTQLFSYQGIDLSADGALSDSGGKILMAIASNGRSLGGAFRIAPTASVIDGNLDFCLFTDCSVLGRARRFVGALRGTHLTLPGVASAKTNSLTLSFVDKPGMEMDGELRQATSCELRIECVPKALMVIAAPGSPV